MMAPMRPGNTADWMQNNTVRAGGGLPISLA
jgi:hypothetical protein